jgi:hypothetical protein
MDGRNHLVTQWNSKRSAGAEVVLHVDDEQNVMRVDLHVSSLAPNRVAQ